MAGNPLPQLVTLLKHFAGHPLDTLYTLLKGYEGYDERVVRVLLRWVFKEDCHFDSLVDVVNEVLGDGMGDALLLLPDEFAVRLENACRDLRRALDEMRQCGYKYSCIASALGREVPWLRDLPGVTP